MRTILQYLKPYKKGMIFGPFCKLLEAIFELIVPIIMANIIDTGIANRDSVYVWKMAGLMILLSVCGLIFSLICQYTAADCAFHFGADLRRGLYHHMNQLSYAEFDRIGTASLGTRLTADTTAVQAGVNMCIRLAVRAPFLVIGAMTMAFLLDWKLAMIFLLVTPLVSILLYLVSQKTLPLYRNIQKKLERIFCLTRENLEGVRVIRAFSRQREEETEFAAASDALAQESVVAGRIAAISNPITFLILNLGIVAILWFGGIRIDSGSLSVGELTAFVNYMTQILMALIALAYLISIFAKAFASAGRVEEILKLAPSMQPGSVAALPQTADTFLEFDGVSFAYQGGEAVLTNINFSLQPGQTLGIIGGTGSGKSTILNLIPRFYDVTAGEVRVQGIPVQSYQYQALRGAIGLVPQQAVLFSGTILQNMRRIAPDATEEAVIAALKLAQAWEFVSKMPDGLQTMLNQGGTNLSGGQRQRLTIARALVAQPKLLILDDSMSALDYATDFALRQALATQLRDTTVILVSQRATSLIHADKILVLDDGEQVGLGTHAELLADCTVYQEICAAQMKKEA